MVENIVMNFVGMQPQWEKKKDEKGTGLFQFHVVDIDQNNIENMYC